MKVSLICPVYNEVDNLEKLIDSMLTQSKRPDEIIFVDNFSKDGTDKIIKVWDVRVQKNVAEMDGSQFSEMNEISMTS